MNNPLSRRRFLHGLAAAGLGLTSRFSRPTSAASREEGAPPAGSLTDIAGLKVGHFTDPRRPTGCTVILAEAGAVGGVDVRGGAPGTRETDLLDPVNTVEKVHAIVLSGGSAFGLDTATGVMRYLEERGIGFDVRIAKVPIVPAAILFDLGVGDPNIRPDAEAGYRACTAATGMPAATGGPAAEGSVGAGAGATVGKLAGRERMMKGGIGQVCFRMPDGLKVGAIVAVNAAGDVYDPKTGRILAGARSSGGKGFINMTARVRTTGAFRPPAPAQNTTIGVIATNAALHKVQAHRIAQVGHDGLARAVNPAHLPADGDTLFTMATGAHPGPVDLSLLSILAAEAVSEAVVRAIKTATGLPGIPSYREYVSSGP